MNLEPCDAIYRSRPEWATGYISWDDAHYLYSRVVERAPRLVVEIGTASGLSTAIIARALAETHQDGDYAVVSYDITDRFYADPTHAVGDATRELLEPEVLAHVEFRQGTVSQLADFHADGELAMVFIDANHTHPAPATDLRGVLPFVRAGGEVLMHDIKPVPDPRDAGAKVVFDTLPAEKFADTVRDPPNIGSVIIPGDKQPLERHLDDLIATPESDLPALLGRASSSSAT